MLREKIRWSCGAGLVFLLGIARVELNYCVPFGVQNSDRYYIATNRSTWKKTDLSKH